MTAELRQAPRRPLPQSRHSARPPAAPLAQGVLFWERLWPVLAAAAAPIFLLAVAALFGVFNAVPGLVHLGLLGAAAATSAAIVLRLQGGVRWPDRRHALERLEEDGGLRHAPLQALSDRPFAADAESPLWRAHMETARAKSGAARLHGPRATADALDPFSLRYLAPGLLAVALVAAGPERDSRIARLFQPFFGDSRIAGADVWIEPPAYTGQAPVFLARAGEALPTSPTQTDVPEGSIVVAQSAGSDRLRLSFRTPDEVLEGAVSDIAGRRTLILDRSGVLRLRITGADARWPVGVAPDASPAVAFLETPSTTDDARLSIAVIIDDDFGPTGASLELRVDPDQERPLDAPAFDAATLQATRTIALDGLAGGPGERRFDLDMQSDPWAGLIVVGVLHVVDGAGQKAQTEEARFRLPARPFFNPLARAVVEQRQTLAVAPGSWATAGRSFDALTLAPERFYDRSRDYLLMRTAFWRVMRQDGETFDDAVEEFWPLALQLEDEALELARRQLEAAKEALKQALERGASDAELSRLVEDLREAMQQYLQALAQSGQRMAETGEGGGEALDPSDLERMLDDIRDLAQSGAQNAARQALDDLENILNNLRLAGRGQGQSGQGSGESGEQGEGGAGAAGDLIGRQRDLANRSFERGQSPGATGDDLAAEERGVAEDLQGLIDELASGGPGADPDGAAAQALGDALGAMRDAEDALGAGEFDAANTAMERAISGLREGARAMAEAESRQAQARNGRSGEGAGGAAVDPLGRPVGQASGSGVDVPETSDTQRARDVLQELRRRLSDGEREENEIDYLERLLERF